MSRYYDYRGGGVKYRSSYDDFSYSPQRRGQSGYRNTPSSYYNTTTKPIRTGRKRNPNFMWKPTPGGDEKAQRSGHYDHENVEQDLIESTKAEENKDDGILKRGVYYHHDRKTTRHTSKLKEKDDDITKNTEKEKQDLKKLKKNDRQIKMKKIQKKPYFEYDSNDYQNYNSKRIAYDSNVVERSLLNDSRNSRKRQYYPAPYPPNHITRSSKNSRYQQPYIDSPNGRNRRRQREAEYYDRRYDNRRYPTGGYNPYGVPLPGSPALIQYDANMLDYETRKRYGAVFPDGLWYPYPDTGSYSYNYKSTKKSSSNKKKGTKVIKNKTPIKNKDSDEAEEIQLSPGARVNRVQNQLEYYLSERNLKKDKHLRSLLSSDGWVNVAEIEKFPRMKRFGATKDVIIEAAYHSNFIEVRNNDSIRMKEHWDKFIEENKKELKAIAPKIADKGLVSKKEIKGIVKAIEDKVKKYKERQKKKQEKKKVKDEETKQDKKEEEKDDGLETALKEMNKSPNLKPETKEKSDDVEEVDVD